MLKNVSEKIIPFITNASERISRVVKKLVTQKVAQKCRYGIAETLNASSGTSKGSKRTAQRRTEVHLVIRKSYLHV